MHIRHVSFYFNGRAEDKAFCVLMTQLCTYRPTWWRIAEALCGRNTSGGYGCSCTGESVFCTRHTNVRVSVRLDKHGYAYLTTPRIKPTDSVVTITHHGSGSNSGRLDIELPEEEYAACKAFLSIMAYATAVLGLHTLVTVENNITVQAGRAHAAALLWAMEDHYDAMVLWDRALEGMKYAVA